MTTKSFQSHAHVFILVFFALWYVIVGVFTTSQNVEEEKQMFYNHTSNNQHIEDVP